MRFASSIAVLALATAAHRLSAQDSTKAVADSGAHVAAPASADTAPKVTFGGFVDGYYAFDSNRPSTFDRAFTTQPARHNEFNINLAFVEAKLTGPRYRGRLALQFGTSVQANYAGEPTIGHVSGPSVSQYLQEATVGYQVAPTLWLDGGIFFAHTGYEGWISRDQLTYTRSLIADYSPYYETGVKATWQPTAAITAQLDLINGWQNISKYNTAPAVGARIDYVLDPKVTLSYDNFLGNVAPDTVSTKLRFFNDFIVQYNPTASWNFAGMFDVGTQGRSSPDGGTATWYGASLIGKYHFSPKVAVVGRVERYADPDQAIIVTGVTDGFKTNGASLGLDIAPVPRVLWRSEVRGFFSSSDVWPAHNPNTFEPNDAVIVTSLSLTI